MILMLRVRKLFVLIKREIIGHKETVEFRREANDFFCENVLVVHLWSEILSRWYHLRDNLCCDETWGQPLPAKSLSGEGGVHQCASTASFIITTFIEEQFKEQWGLDLSQFYLVMTFIKQTNLSMWYIKYNFQSLIEHFHAEI